MLIPSECRNGRESESATALAVCSVLPMHDHIMDAAMQMAMAACKGEGLVPPVSGRFVILF